MSSNVANEPNVSCSTDVQQKIRMDMVNAAKQFMTNPRVQLTPLAEQKEFLSKKGLTEAEIEAALSGIEVRNQTRLGQVNLIFSFYIFLFLQQLQPQLGGHVHDYSNNNGGNGNKVSIFCEK